MRAPQIIMIVIYAIEIIDVGLHHGEAKTHTKKDIGLTVLNTIIMFGLLWWGGFFG